MAGKFKISVIATLFAAFLFLSSMGIRISSAQGALHILHDDVIAHPGPHAKELDRALAGAFPQWVSFQQKLEWYDLPGLAWAEQRSELKCRQLM